MTDPKEAPTLGSAIDWVAIVSFVLPFVGWAFLPTDPPGVFLIVAAVCAVMGVVASLAVATALLRRVHKVGGVWIYGFCFLALLNFIFSFALAYLTLSSSPSVGADQFSEPLTRVSSLYFATTASTSGFGDVYATSGVARLLVSAQVFLSFVLVVGVFSAVVSEAATAVRRSGD